MEPYSQLPERPGNNARTARWTETNMNTEMRQSTTGRGLWLSGALKYIGRSALELHRYRYIRTRMLHDSLDRIDASSTEDRARGK
jgi:hypothetical protein